MYSVYVCLLLLGLADDAQSVPARCAFLADAVTSERERGVFSVVVCLDRVLVV